jgi:AAA family ATP:ADP antiporter
VAKIAENSVDYSIQNTARHALFLNTSRDAKYKAQSATEGFFWRAGDALSALLVFVGTLLVFNVSDFAIANLIFVGIWLGVAAALARRTKQGPEAVEETRSAA